MRRGEEPQANLVISLGGQWILPEGGQPTCMMRSACEREDWSFMLVEAVARSLHPESYLRRKNGVGI